MFSLRLVQHRACNLLDCLGFSLTSLMSVEFLHKSLHWNHQEVLFKMQCAADTLNLFLTISWSKDMIMKSWSNRIWDERAWISIWKWELRNQTKQQAGRQRGSFGRVKTWGWATGGAHRKECSICCGHHWFSLHVLLFWLHCFLMECTFSSVLPVS